jgi:predicted nucleic acid-binding protein
MIYVDSSVFLAYLLGQDVAPPASFWEGALTSSRLLEFEAWNRLHALGLAEEREAEARELLSSLEIFELAEPVIARALKAYPMPVRTLDGLHLATLEFARRRSPRIELATYDRRMGECARAMGFEVLEP